MTSSLYKTLLTISFISLSINAMEKDPIALCAKPTASNQNLYHISNLYKKAYNTLEKYNPSEKSSVTALSEIIKQTEELKSKNIHEKVIGKFAYQQELVSKNSFPFFDKNPNNDPLYVSVFFERIAQYNANLKKNGFTSPTPTEFTNYINNKTRTDAIEKASTFRLFIDIAKIDPNKEIIIDIPLSIATQEFEKLIHDVSEMQQLTPAVIKTIANILYGFESAKKSAESSERL